jgi:hypothetical protein
VAEASPIIYSGLQNITVNAPGFYGLDLNADSVVDFLFEALENSSQFVVVVPQGTNAVAKAGFPKAQRLNFGDPIPNGLEFTFDTFTMLLAKRRPYGKDFGNWTPDGTPGFLGVRFDISGDTHYGWVRVGVTFGSTSFRIVDWAYNSTPGEALKAGEPIPEPSTLSLMALGAAGLLALRRRRNQKAA